MIGILQMILHRAARVSSFPGDSKSTESYSLEAQDDHYILYKKCQVICKKTALKRFFYIGRIVQRYLIGKADKLTKL